MKKGEIYINNGVEEKLHDSKNPIPEGFAKGRLKKTPPPNLTEKSQGSPPAAPPPTPPTPTAPAKPVSPEMVSRQVIDSLRAMSANVDSHWEEDGAPKLAVVRIISGNDKIQAEDILEHAPAVRRDTVEAWKASFYNQSPTGEVEAAPKGYLWKCHCGKAVVRNKRPDCWHCGAAPVGWVLITEEENDAAKRDAAAKRAKEQTGE